MYFQANNRNCILGETIEYQRRKPNAICYYGPEFKRLKPKSLCQCTAYDYEWLVNIKHSLLSCTWENYNMSNWMIKLLQTISKSNKLLLCWQIHILSKLLKTGIFLVLKPHLKALYLFSRFVGLSILHLSFCPSSG